MAGDQVAAETSQATPAELRDAFAAAFGHAAPFTVADTINNHGGHLTYTPSAIVDVVPGVIALISKGESDDACHACAGTLSIHYLKKNEQAFSLLGSWPTIGGSASFGQAADWEIRTDIDEYPAVVTTAEWAGMGCQLKTSEIIALAPTRPIVRQEGIAVVTKYDGGLGPDSDSKKYEMAGTIEPTERGKRFVVQYSGTRSLRVEYARSGDVYLPQGEEAPGC